MGKLSAINKIEWKDIDVGDVELFESIGENAEGIAMFSFCSMFCGRAITERKYRWLRATLSPRAFRTRDVT